MVKVNGVVVTGPDGQEYIFPEPLKDDWEAWILLHEGEGMPPWTPPAYAYVYADWLNDPTLGT